MYQPLIKFHPYPAIITQVLRIFVCAIPNSKAYEKLTREFYLFHKNSSAVHALKAPANTYKKR